MVKKLILAMLMSMNLAVKASALEDSIQAIEHSQKALMSLIAKTTELTPEVRDASINFLNDTVDGMLEVRENLEETVSALSLEAYDESTKAAAKKFCEALRTNNKDIIIDAIKNLKTIVIEPVKINLAQAGKNIINDITDATSEVTALVKTSSETGAKLSEQALEIAKSKIEAAKDLLNSLVSQTSSVAKNVQSWAKENPDLAILAGLTGALVGSGIVAATLDYWSANHKTINSKTHYNITDLIAILTDENRSFSTRDRAFEGLKKYTRFEPMYKNLYYYINSKDGLLNNYQQYKQYAEKKQQFMLAAEHVKTELRTNLAIYQA